MENNQPATPPTHKTCTKCGELKELEAFSMQQGGKYGRRSFCKVCKSNGVGFQKKYRVLGPIEEKGGNALRMRERYTRRLESTTHKHQVTDAIKGNHPGLSTGISFRVVLPLPSKTLCSNSPPLTTGGRIARSGHTKRYRNLAAQRCEQFNSPEDGPPMLRKASAKLYFFFKDKRRRDIRNFEAGMKAAYDGLVDGGLIIDDNADVLTHEPTVFDIDPVAPRVEIIITNLEAA